MSGGRDKDAWLARPATVRLLWRVFWVVLIMTVAAQFVFPVKADFDIDGWPAFGAVFGFLSCLAMVLVAKALSFALKREENYYEEKRDDT